MDPIYQTELMDVLNLANEDMNNVPKFRRFEEVARFFKDDPGYRQDILRIIAGKPTQDKLDLVWTYVQLQKAKREKIGQLKPSMFAEDIDEELRKGALSLEAKKRIRQDVERKIAEKKKKEQHEEERRLAKEERVLSKVDDTLESTREVLDDLDFIEEQLAAYG